MGKTKKKKMLPKDFEILLERGNLEELKALFDNHEVNARGGVFKQTALAFARCPDELARWLVSQGADLAAGDSYGDTPLHSLAGHWQGRVDVLLELGADVNLGGSQRGTPLHSAARVCNLAAAESLLRHGAKVEALNGEGRTPLGHLLKHCHNANLPKAVAMAQVLLASGARPTEEMTSLVTRIGTEFEFHRANFNPESVDECSAALDRLYAIFGVPPVPRRLQHDGKSSIVARSAPWQDQHAELWELLVPSRGAAATVQGEVVRIAGRINDELERNGGVNWDDAYRKMADAFLSHVSSGVPLPAESLAAVREIVAAVKRQQGDALRLAEFGVSWIALNPTPMKLPKPDYNR